MAHRLDHAEPAAVLFHHPRFARRREPARQEAAERAGQARVGAVEVGVELGERERIVGDPAAQRAEHDVGDLRISVGVARQLLVVLDLGGGFARGSAPIDEAGADEQSEDLRLLLGSDDVAEGEDHVAEVGASTACLSHAKSAVPRCSLARLAAAIEKPLGSRSRPAAEGAAEGGRLREAGGACRLVHAGAAADALERDLVARWWLRVAAAEVRRRSEFTPRMLSTTLQ